VVTDTVPTKFAPDKPLALDVTTDAPAVRLHYRHVNQAEPWHVLGMTATGAAHHAEIPAAYTDSPYPLEYYFEVRPAGGRPWLYPGLDDAFSNQPYFVVRQRLAVGRPQ